MAALKPNELKSSTHSSQGLAMVAEIDKTGNLTGRRCVSRAELGVTVPARRKHGNRQKRNMTCADARSCEGHQFHTAYDAEKHNPTADHNVRRIVLDLEQNSKSILQDRAKVCFSNADLKRISSKVRVTKGDSSSEMTDMQSPRCQLATNPTSKQSSVAVNSRSGLYDSAAGSSTVIGNQSVTSSCCAEDLLEEDGTSSVDPLPSTTRVNNEQVSVDHITGSSFYSNQVSANFSSSVDPVASASDSSQLSASSASVSQDSLVYESDNADIYNTLESPFNPTFVKMLGQHEANLHAESTTTVEKLPRIENLAKSLSDTIDPLSASGTSSGSGARVERQSMQLSNPMTFAEVMLLGVIHEKLGRLERDIQDCRDKASRTASEFAQLHQDSIAISEQVSTVKKSVKKTINDIDKVTYLDNLIDHLNEVNTNMILKPFYVDIGAYETAV